MLKSRWGLRNIEWRAVSPHLTIHPSHPRTLVTVAKVLSKPQILLEFTLGAEQSGLTHAFLFFFLVLHLLSQSSQYLPQKWLMSLPLAKRTQRPRKAKWLARSQVPDSYLNWGLNTNNLTQVCKASSVLPLPTFPVPDVSFPFLPRMKVDIPASPGFPNVALLLRRILKRPSCSFLQWSLEHGKAGAVGSCDALEDYLEVHRDSKGGEAKRDEGKGNIAATSWGAEPPELGQLCRCRTQIPETQILQVLPMLDSRTELSSFSSLQSICVVSSAVRLYFHWPLWKTDGWCRIFSSGTEWQPGFTHSSAFPILCYLGGKILKIGNQGDGPVNTKLFPKPIHISISFFRLNVYIN